MNNKDYDKLKKQMRQMIRMAKEVIEEIEKESPDNILISDITTEEMDELLQQVFSTVTGDNFPVRNIYDNP